MTTDPAAATITQLASLVMAADRSAADAERDLGAAMADLNAAHLREAALAGELIAARKALAEQQQHETTGGVEHARDGHRVE